MKKLYLVDWNAIATKKGVKFYTTDFIGGMCAGPVYSLWTRLPTKFFDSMLQKSRIERLLNSIF